MVSFHLQLEDYSSALASMRLPFEQGLLNKEGDFRQMTQLLFHEGLPYLSGKTLSRGLDSGAVAQTVKNLKLLASIWSQAKEFDLAIDTFHRLAELESDTRWYKQLAQLYFKKKEWSSAITVLKKISHDHNEPDLRFMLGIAFINTQSFQEAREVLYELKSEEAYEKRIGQWLSYIDKVGSHSSST